MQALTQIVAPHLRGRALAVVNAGLATAIVLGLPLEAVIGDLPGWRTTFLVIAALRAIAVAGLVFGLKIHAGKNPPTFSLWDRMSVAQQPMVLLALVQTAIWATGSYSVWTYIAPYVTAVANVKGSDVSSIVFVWGAAGAIGLFAGGYINDKLGSKTIVVGALSLVGSSFVVLSASAALLPPDKALTHVTIAIFVWGFSTWGFVPGQVARLIGMVGAASALRSR